MAQPAGEGEWQPLVQDLVSRSPSYQLGSVVSNCRQLLAPVTVPPDFAAKLCREHNEAALLAVPLGDLGSVGIVCEAGRTREGNYIDPRSGGRLFEVDHEAQECRKIVAAPDPWSGLDAAKPYRDAVEIELDAYLAGHFPQAGGAIAGGAAYLESSGSTPGSFTVRIAISSRQCRPRGYWAGTWASSWSVTFDPQGKGPVVVEGTICFATHYAEDGNVHFRRKVDRSESIACAADAASFGRDLVRAVRNAEEAFHSETDDLCSAFGGGSLKVMRRVLPLSKERFDWRPIRHALVRDMKDASKDGAH